jgi:two-component system, chemotaxis family, chemotaxis protein CheY
MRVLVIEDNADLRDVVRLALEHAGHQVLTAKQGLEGLAYLSGHPVDLVVTDLFMPEMDGIEVIAALRRRFPGVRIVAMSGRPGVDYLAVAKELGAARILRKPFVMDDLLNAVEASV